MKNKYQIRGDVTAVFINSEKYGPLETIIDTEDLIKVKSFSGTWFVNSNSNGYLYVVGKLTIGIKKQKTIILHRFIIDADHGLEVDHINHNTLRNTRNNLRVLTKSENQQNRQGANRTSRSGIRGVHWIRKKRLWRAELQVGGKAFYIGSFKDIEKAKEAVINARRIMMPCSKDARKKVQKL